MSDELIDGRISGWPVSIFIMRNAGERGVFIQAAPYSGPNDEGSPATVARLCDEIDGDFKSRAAALKFAAQHGFVPDHQ
jgi:hypothetical protein